jgi:hypothetical protein
MCWSMTCTMAANSRSPSACMGSRRISLGRIGEQALGRPWKKSESSTQLPRAYARG